jgi:hypothetical protein
MRERTARSVWRRTLILGVAVAAGGTGCFGRPRDCWTGARRCAGSCVELSSDVQNRGACGVACPLGASCVPGRCTCGAGAIRCSDVCASVDSDGATGGACGVACPAGAWCAVGADGLRHLLRRAHEQPGVVRDVRRGVPDGRRVRERDLRLPEHGPDPLRRPLHRHRARLEQLRRLRHRLLPAGHLRRRELRVQLRPGPDLLPVGVRRPGGPLSGAHPQPPEIFLRAPPAGLGLPPVLRSEGW